MHPPDNASTGADPISTSDQDDAIVRVASYYRRDYNLAVIHPTIPLDSSGLTLFKSFRRDSASTLGLLETLPPELLKTVFLLLDLQSALRFSHANTRAKDLIAGTWEYRQTRDHALQCLWAAFQTRVASNLGVSLIYTALKTKACSVCGVSFGRFFFLLTATQCCFRCLGRAPDLVALSLAEVCRATSRSRAWLKKAIPALYTVPGIYGLAEMNSSRRCYLVSKAHCHSRLDLEKTQWLRLATSQGPMDSRYMASCSIPYLDIATGDVQMGVSCKGCQVMLEARAPGSRSTVPFLRREEVYSRQGFLDHFRWCEGAKGLWDSSKGGTVPFEEPTFTKQGGFLAKRDYEP